ncbi:hypothetical protein [Nonomuraea sp. NPDC050786]|uniref:hypothetical protein n=1 Tax=Nonomuraea sp. NPDC050786 TaxID=3154840 RepID=UPI0033C79621
MYEYFIGWRENYEADRAAAEAPRLNPDARDPYAESDPARVDFVGGAGRKA